MLLQYFIAFCVFNTQKLRNKLLKYNKMRRAIIYFLMLFAGCVAMAQRVNIKGVVQDSQSGEKLMFANCILQYKTDTIGIFKGETTNENGEFEFKKIKKRNIILKVSYVGYNIFRREISEKDFIEGKDIDLGVIAMEKDELQVVEITAQRKRIEIDDDKMNVNIDENMAAMVSSAFDLLRLVPGVMIDGDEKLTLNGKSGVQFQYNGRELKMDWDGIKDMLKSMSPEMIEQFEVLKNPGVRYDAEGTAGIINIKMKKAKNYGLNGTVNLGSGYENKINYSFNEGMRLNFVNDKWIISAGMNNSNSWYGTYYKEDSSYRYTWVGKDTTLFKYYSGADDATSAWRGVDFSASYSLDTTSTLSFDARYNYNKSPFNQSTDETYMSHAPHYYDVDSSYFNTSGYQSNGSSASFGLGYVKKLSADDTKFSMDLDYSTNSNETSSLSDVAYYNKDNATEEELLRRQGYKRQNESESHNASFRADYYKPLGRGNRFEMGIKSKISYSDRDYNSLLFNQATNEYTNNPYESNRFKYTENINSFYASLTNKYFDKKLSVRLGLRMEQTNTKGEQVNNGEINTLHYFNVFPNVRLGYKFSDDKELGLNYSYRLRRPWSSQLNPFVKKSDDYNYSTGNPALEPSYSHSFNLSYSSDFAFFPSLSYTHSYNESETMRVPLDDSWGITDYNALAQITYPINFGTSDMLGLDLSYNKSIGTTWYIGISGGVDYTHIASTAGGIKAVSNDGFSYNIQANVFGTIMWDIRLSAFFMYYSSNITGFGKGSGWQYSNISLSRDFFDKKLNVSFSVRLPQFKDSYNESTYMNYRYETWRQKDKPMFHVSLRYKFGKFYQNKQVQKQQLQSHDDQEDGGEQRR